MNGKPAPASGLGVWMNATLTAAPSAEWALTRSPCTGPALLAVCELPLGEERRRSVRGLTNNHP
jgi:hypothetical protein